MADVTESFCDVFYILFGVVDIVSIFSIAWRSPELPHYNAYKKFVSSHTTLFRQNILDVQCHLRKDLYSYCVYQCDLSVISICGLNSRTKPKNSMHHSTGVSLPVYIVCTVWSTNWAWVEYGHLVVFLLHTIHQSRWTIVLFLITYIKATHTFPLFRLSGLNCENHFPW